MPRRSHSGGTQLKKHESIYPLIGLLLAERMPARSVQHRDKSAFRHGTGDRALQSAAGFQMLKNLRHHIVLWAQAKTGLTAGFLSSLTSLAVQPGCCLFFYV